MKRTIILPEQIGTLSIPDRFAPLLSGAYVYDSSSSPEARVYYIDRDGGLFLKSSTKGSLERESLMTSYFASIGLSVRVLDYFSDERDWLLTESAVGEDATHPSLIDDPKRLCRCLAAAMLDLHSRDYSTCPAQNRLTEYIQTAHYNYKHHLYSDEHFPDNFGYRTANEAWTRICEHKDELVADTLIHGDFCLPNILFKDWQFSSFIDLGNSGVADRHIDIFWCLWTLWFNLHTNEYYDYLIDAYGRHLVDHEKLRTVAAFEVFG